LRGTFIDLSDRLLAVSADTLGTLTTIYVKYQINSSPNSEVYAVAWLKTSKQIVVGLALPKDLDSPHLVSAPVGMNYKGITKYFKIAQGDSLPTELDEWAKMAFHYVCSQSA